DYLINGELHGKATMLAPNDYDYEASVNYQYTNDPLFGRLVEEPTGHGFSIDIDIDFQFTAEWSAQLQITDLMGQIYWQDLPYTVAVANSDRKEFDDEGYVHINPALSGKEWQYSNYTYDLTPRSKFCITHTYQNDSAFIEGYYQYDYFLWALGNKIDTGKGYLLLKYWPENRALTLGYKLNRFEIDLTADHYEIDKKKTFKLIISYSF
ncbi:MAG: hypothetical protein GY756_15965, partial [bacterium]|nr:hypothetical protein [bacterium]